MMKSSAILTCIAILIFFQVNGKIRPTELLCEYLENPMVIDVINPRLSWINIAEEGERGQKQTAWMVRVAGSKEKLLEGNTDLWNSGKIISGNSVNIAYNGKPLKSRQDCWWQVKVWDKDGMESDWSKPAFWSMGLLNADEWKAKWIGVPWQNDAPLPVPAGGPNAVIRELPPPAPMIRKSFSINKKVEKARAYVCGLGYFEFYINGAKVGDDVLIPNQTNYGKRPDLTEKYIPLEDNFREYKVMYLAYDITDMLKNGTNVAGCILGNGFYNAAKYWAGSYGSPRFLGQIHVTYTDGSQELIASDTSWKVSKSPILMDMVYYGEHYDARLEQPGWCSAGFDDSKWEQAVLRKSPDAKLKAHMAPADKVMECLKPIKIDKLGEGHFKVDFGQEISGWANLSGIVGEKGRKIEIKYVHKVPTGDNSYVLNGNSPESYAARFTWFVFREVEIINYPGELSPDQIKAEAVYTQVKTTGIFECSNDLFNKINNIWRRSQTDNMHGGIASDCPNRERSPYTGDGQVSCVTVMHNFDVKAFYRKWIDDIIGSQNVETGYVPNGAPWQPGCGGGPAWGAAISIMPWEFYLHYGDKQILDNSYEAMKGYIRYMLTWTDENGIMFSQARKKDGSLSKWINLGEWSPADKLPPDDLVHTFYLWRCADIAAKSAKILGKEKEFEEYSALAEKVKKGFHSKFYDNEKGTYGAYGANIFALRIGVPGERKEKVIESLKSDIKSSKGHIDTGIFGTQFFFEMLSENGLHELAYEAMNKRTAPGYGWWVEQGTTTTWEGWERPGSGNHPMFGGGLVWLYRKLAGIETDPEQPGYKHIIFHPRLVGDLSFVSYSNLTPFGLAGIRWEKNNGNFFMDISVPVGSAATVYIPTLDRKKIRENTEPLKSDEMIKYIRMDGGYAVYSVASGNYKFTVSN